MTSIKTGNDYIKSLRNRNLNVYLLGEKISEPVDHPIIRPSINAVAMTYDLATENPDLGTAVSPFTKKRIKKIIKRLKKQKLNFLIIQYQILNLDWLEMFF